MTNGVKIFIAGVGGQGSLTLSRLLGEAALLAGANVVVSEVHGMSQRGGVVESSVLIGDFKSPLIGLGDADLLVSFEPLEALRAAAYLSGKTVVVMNERKSVPFSVSLDMGEYPEVDAIADRLSGLSKRVYRFDAQALAEKAGSPLSTNVVFMGALHATGLLPITHEFLVKAILEKTPEKFARINLKAFELGTRALTRN